MVPYSYNMVDMGGIDLAEADGTVVDGLYNRIALARNACGDLILFNWKFAGIEIAPSACSTIDAGTSIIINGDIEVTDEDVVSIITIQPDPPVITPLEVQENGVYEPPTGVDGYAPVTVNVSGGGGDDWQSLKNYIESSGTQYIDTGYIANSNTELELVIALSSSLTQYAALFGARNGDYYSSTKEFLAYRDTSKMSCYVGSGAAKGAITYTPYISNKAKWTMSKTRFGVIDSSGVNYYGIPINGGLVDDVNTIYLLSFNQSGSDIGASARCAGKVYRFRIYENDILVHEFIPWQENGVACLKDTVTSNLLYNAGAGDFVYGTDA